MKNNLKNYAYLIILKTVIAQQKKKGTPKHNFLLYLKINRQQ